MSDYQNPVIRPASQGNFGGFGIDSSVGGLRNALLNSAASGTPLGQSEIREQAATGIKHDQEKPDMSLLSNTALVKIAEVMTFGKKKYTAHNWRGGFVWSRPLAAAARHLFAFIGGEDKDPETGLSHLAHACCCLFFVLEFEETRKDLDDRYKELK